MIKIRGRTKNKGNTKEIKIPKKDKKLAEFIGVVLEDGNIHAYKKGTKRRSYSIRIAGDSTKDYEYLTKYVSNLSKKLFGITPSIRKEKNGNGMHINMYGIRLIEFFIKMGLKPGNKIENKLSIPSWIWKKESYLKACLRGLYDTDGSVYEMLPHWPGLFQIYFSNRNLFLLNDVRNALLSLGYKVSKISNLKENSTPRIYITRKDQIKKFYKNIGFKNQKHIKKFGQIIAP